MRLLPVLSILLFTPITVAAQFSTGSTGVDGALVYAVGDGSPRFEIFDPTTHLPPLDVDGDAVYHFTTITIPSNVTVRLRSDKCGFKPLYWLASGAVSIDGVLDLSGEPPVEYPAGTTTFPTIPGPGGFPGGVAANSELVFGQPGFGPGAGTFQGAEGSHASGGFMTFFFPTIYGNPYIQPLIGGSGGAGGAHPTPPFTTVFNGGAGGGAILIASNNSIMIAGSILAYGGRSPGRAGEPNGGDGQGGFSGDGSGGAIRLAAPTIGGSGSLIAGPELLRYHYGGMGRIRMEALNNTFTGTVVGDNRRVTLHPQSPLGIPSAATEPLVLIKRIGGVSVPGRPTGSFIAADINLSTDQPIVFEIEAQRVPLDAVITLYLFSGDTLNAPIFAEPLAGDLQASTTTATATIPAGFTKGFVVTTWIPQ